MHPKPLPGRTTNVGKLGKGSEKFCKIRKYPNTEFIILQNPRKTCCPAENGKLSATVIGGLPFDQIESLVECSRYENLIELGQE